MGTKQFRPTTPSLRFTILSDYQDVTRGARTPKSLKERIKSSGGRNNMGHITSWHRGGGNIRMWRRIDFRRDKVGVPGKVEAIEYDPNRTARIALIAYPDGDRRYILAPLGLAIGQTVQSGKGAEPATGNCLPLADIPVGTPIHNIEIHQGRGGQMVRTAGGMAQLTAREGEWALVRLPSSEVRKIHIRCTATIGQLGFVERDTISIGKAGRNRWRGIRPTVRGVAMNPVDHPLGGGQGKTSGGRQPCSPWGQKAKGLKTRRGKKYSDRWIVSKRFKKNA